VWLGSFDLLTFGIFIYIWIVLLVRSIATTLLDFFWIDYNHQ
jgi:hypothetical protein